MQSRLQGLRVGEKEQGNQVYDAEPTTGLRKKEKDQGNQVFDAKPTASTEGEKRSKGIKCMMQ